MEIKTRGNIIHIPEICSNIKNTPILIIANLYLNLIRYKTHSCFRWIQGTNQATLRCRSSKFFLHQIQSLKQPSSLHLLAHIPGIYDMVCKNLWSRTLKNSSTVNKFVVIRYKRQDLMRWIHVLICTILSKSPKLFAEPIDAVELEVSRLFVL